MRARRSAARGVTHMQRRTSELWHRGCLLIRLCAYVGLATHRSAGVGPIKHGVDVVRGEVLVVDPPRRVVDYREEQVQQRVCQM